MCFFLKMLWFFWTLRVLLHRWSSTCLVCVHTLTPKENNVRNFSKKSEKNIIFNEHSVYYLPLQVWLTRTKSWITASFVYLFLLLMLPLPPAHWCSAPRAVDEMSNEDMPARKPVAKVTQQTFVLVTDLACVINEGHASVRFANRLAAHRWLKFMIRLG